MDDLAPNGFPRGWWGGKRPNQTGRPKKRKNPTKVYRLTEDWGEFAKWAMTEMEEIPEDLHWPLGAVVRGDWNGLKKWVESYERECG